MRYASSFFFIILTVTAISLFMGFVVNVLDDIEEKYYILAMGDAFLAVIFGVVVIGLVIILIRSGLMNF